jgi:hypothetical protein
MMQFLNKVAIVRTKNANVLRKGSFKINQTGPRTTPRYRENVSSQQIVDGLNEASVPEFCNGMAYLVTPDLAAEFLKASTMVSPFDYSNYQAVCKLLSN